MKLLKKIVKGLIIGLTGMTVLLVAVLLFIKIAEPIAYSGFYSIATREFEIPALDSGYVPQGLARTDDCFIACGYMKNGQPSRIYVIGGEGLGYATMAYPDGEDCFTHAGGIAAYGDYVYVCDAEKDSLLVFSLSEVKQSAEQGIALRALGSIIVHVKPSFLHVSGDILYVGEFYREQNYKTDESHHIKMPTGETNHALILGYRAEDAIPNSAAVPTVAYSVTDLVQGMCQISANGFVLSTSYALASSHNIFYKLPSQPDSSIMINGHALPIYYMHEGNITRDIVLPPMAEEIEFYNGRIYVMNESASDLYVFGKFLRARHVWSYLV